MATWKELLENEKGKSVELWIGRVALAYQQKRLMFTYRELGDLWGVDKQGALVKVNAWAKDYPTLVYVEKNTAPHRVCLAFSGADAWLAECGDSTITPEPIAEVEYPVSEEFTEEETTINYPLFMGDRAYEQIIDRLNSLGVLEDGNTLEFERLGWDAKNQRGGLTTTIFDGKLPVLVAAGRFDNGFLITPLRISTPKLA